MPPKDDTVTHRSVSQTLVPWLLGISAGLLAWIGSTLLDISKSLAVVVAVTNRHEVVIDGVVKDVGDLKGRVRVLEIDKSKER